MANTYSSSRFDEDQVFTLANRLTDQLILPMHARASERAVALYEQRLAAWLGERSQARGALGMVGFDLDELPWSPSKWREQRKFMVGVAQGLAAGSWPRVAADFGLPSQAVVGLVTQASQRLASWFQEWEHNTTLDGSKGLGIAWAPPKPYPMHWDDIPWQHVPIDCCSVHEVWCPTPPGQTPNCVFCDRQR